MSSSTIKSFAERSGKSIEEVEKIWNDAKAQAEGKFENKDDKFWAYVNRKTQFKLGLANKKTSFKEFSKDKKKKED